MKKNIAFILLICFLIMLARFVLGNRSAVTYDELIIIDKVILIAGVSGAFGFWFLMLADFFNNKAINNKVLWGFALIFLSWASSIVYFVFHFLPRSRSMGSE